jgi:hypothetical protein
LLPPSGPSGLYFILFVTHEYDFDLDICSARGSQAVGKLCPVASYTVGTGSFPGVKRPVRGVNQPNHLAPKLKNE